MNLPTPGQQMFGDKLAVESVDAQRITLSRNATGKPVIVTLAMIQKAHDHIASNAICGCGCGNPGIKRRTISYTSAQEAVVIECLGDLVKTESNHYVRNTA